MHGSLDLAALITDRTTLNEAPEALHRMARGEGARSVVLFGTSGEPARGRVHSARA